MVGFYSTQPFSLNEPLCNLGMSSSKMNSEEIPLTKWVLAIVLFTLAGNRAASQGRCQGT